MRESNFQKPPKVKELPNRRELAQSGHLVGDPFPVHFLKNFFFFFFFWLRASLLAT
jgi:hypothetical protein